MAIQNASDLLVYAKTTAAAKQVTRIYVKEVDPLELPDGSTTGTIKINNITNNSGVVSDDVSTNPAQNTAANIIGQINTLLTSKNYSSTSNVSVTINGVAYKYRDFTNGAVGIVPTLEIVNGTATLNEDAVIIEIVTPGSSAIFDPVAFSTSASFSVNMDLRDITNKDSGGYSESLGGLRSFEVSTDILQSINPDVPLDGTDFFDKLKNRSLVDLSFSDRIRNIIRTNLTQIGVDGFTANGVTQTNLQADPFSGSTASKIISGSSGTTSRLQYTADATRLADKKISWSFYVKGTTGTGAKTECKFNIYRLISGTPTVFPASSITWSILEGDGTLSTTDPANTQVNITGLSTSTWTRIQGSVSTEASDAGPLSYYGFYLYPSAGDTAQDDSIFTSSWQIEFSPESTNYQDPTNITHWQGNALVSSVSFDAGVEDNLTCSATFTGTGEIFPNGLGPELIDDTGFDDPSYWGVFGASVVEDGYGKILFTAGAAVSGIEKTGLMTTPGDYYLLTYTVSGSPTPEGTLIVTNGWDQDPSDTQPQIPISSGTHKVLLKPGQTSLQIKRNSTTIDTTVWLSSISLKKVL